MSSSAEHASEIEAEFLAGVRANIGPATAKLLGGKWLEHEEHDASEQVRAAMVDRRIYDRGKYARMPHGRTLTVRGLSGAGSSGNGCGAFRSPPCSPRPAACWITRTARRR